MKHLLIGLFLFLSFFSTTAQEGEESITVIDRFLTEEYPKDEPGAAVLIAKNGEVVFETPYRS